MTINRHVRTDSPHNGLGALALNLPQQWIGYPKISASGAIVTKTQQTAGSSVAAGTQPDYARNVNVVITPTASSAAVTGGGISVYGKDLFGKTRSESFGSLAISAAGGLNGSVNFASIDTVSMLLSFISASSSAASAFAAVVGVGPKLGLPVELISTDAVHAVHLGTAPYQTYSGATSTDNQWSVSSGPYHYNGVMLSGGFSSALLAQIDYNVLGRSVPAPVRDN